MAQEITKFLKVREVISPKRAFPSDAGIDFFVPKFTTTFVKNLKEKNPDLFPKNELGVIATYMTSSVGSSSGSLTLANSSNKQKVTYDLDDENDTFFKFDEEKGDLYFLLPPHSRVLIPSGIHSRMATQGRALIAANKSGVATKHGLVFGAQVVDYTYKGEIHISVINTSTKVVRIYENMKLIQFVETPIIANPIEIVEEKDSSDFVKFYEGLEDDRKAGGFGSTDNLDKFGIPIKTTKSEHLNS